MNTLTQAEAEAHVGRTLTEDEVTYLPFLRKGHVHPNNVLVGYAWVELPTSMNDEGVEEGTKFSTTTVEEEQGILNYVLSHKYNLAGNKFIIAVAAANRKLSPNTPTRVEPVDATALALWDVALSAKGKGSMHWLDTTAYQELVAGPTYTEGA